MWALRGKLDELAKKGLHSLGLNLNNMCFGRYFLQRENQKGGRSEEIKILDGNERAEAGRRNIGES